MDYQKKEKKSTISLSVTLYFSKFTPLQLSKIPLRQRVTCVCEVCIYENIMHAYLTAWGNKKS